MLFFLRQHVILSILALFQGAKNLLLPGGDPSLRKKTLRSG